MTPPFTSLKKRPLPVCSLDVHAMIVIEATVANVHVLVGIRLGMIPGSFWGDCIFIPA